VKRSDGEEQNIKEEKRQMKRKEKKKKEEEEEEDEDMGWKYRKGRWLQVSQVVMWSTKLTE
jgi:hypothetical protein